jgi:predicted RNA-binding Zn ribbon-like protein
MNACGLCLFNPDVLMMLPGWRNVQNSGCGAFFYDTSKNRLRRWCSGTECGNRMRVAAFYERQRRDG